MSLKTIDILDFISSYGMNNKGEFLSIFPLKDCYNYFDILRRNKQIIYKQINNELAYFVTYYRINKKEDIDEIKKFDQSWHLPKNFKVGQFIFVDTLVVNPKYSHLNMTREVINKFYKIMPKIKGAFWINSKNKIQYVLRKRCKR